MEEKIKKQIEEAKKIYGNHIRKFLKNDPEMIKECERILIQFPWFEKIEYVISGLIHGIEEPPKCLYCGKVLRLYEGTLLGKIKCCCPRHAAIFSIEKRKQTCLERYGTTTPLTNSEVKKKTEKTCLEKFGRTTFAGSQEHKEKVLDHLNYDETIPKGIETKRRRYGDDWGKVIFESHREKTEKSNLEKYGVKYLLYSKEFQDKTHDTMYERYGSRYFAGTDEIRQKCLDIGFESILSWSNYVIPLFSREEYVGKKEDIEYKWKCSKCGTIFKSRIYSTGLGEGRTVPRCPVCYKIGAVSIGEKELLYYLEEQGISCIPNDQRTIAPYELDILMPDHKLAIEYNGFYWHKNHERDYHLNKFLQCQSKNIKLLQFFDYEFEKKQILVIQTIFFYLNKIKQEEVDLSKIQTKVCTKQEVQKYYNKKSFSSTAGAYNFSFSLKKRMLSMISVNVLSNCCEIVNFAFEDESLRSLLDYMIKFVEGLFNKIKTRLVINNRIHFKEDFPLFNIVGNKLPQELRKKDFLFYDAGWTILEKNKENQSAPQMNLESIPKSKYYFQKRLF